MQLSLRIFLTWAALAGLLLAPASAQDSAETDPLRYADLADLAADAPVVARVRVKEAIGVEPERSVGAPAGTDRIYVVAETLNLIRGASGLPATIRYIIDLPTDERGRTPRIKRNEFLIFARPLRGGDVQLVAPDAQIWWTEQRDRTVRAIVQQAVQPDAPPPVLGVDSAFHVPGTIIGEGETQIFLKTASGEPVSISIISRENQDRVWAVSLSEIVDEAAGVPVRSSLLWYRLACFLPQNLPMGAMPDAAPENAARAQEDYRLVRDALGPCPRTRPDGGVPVRLY